MPTRLKRAEENKEILKKVIHHSKQGLNPREIATLVPRGKSWIANQLKLIKIK